MMCNEKWWYAALAALLLSLGFEATAADGDLAWAKQFGGTGADLGVRVALDSSGDKYITGCFSNTADFDPNAGVVNLISAGGTDIFIAKITGPGDLVWAKRMGGPNNDYGYEIAVDYEDSVYVTGYYSGTADFDPDSGTENLTSAGANDIFVAKYDKDGALLWAKTMGGAGDDWGYGIRVNDGGNVYTSGSYSGTADFNPGSGTYNRTSAGDLDVFISKLDTDGDFVWALSMGGAGEDRTWCLALDDAGNVHITGSFAGTADFDPGSGVYNLTSVGGLDIFVAKYNSPGNMVWANATGGTSDDYGKAIATDSAGNSFTTGYFMGTSDFDPRSGTVLETSAGGYDFFMWELNSAGNLVWGKAIGGTGDDRGLGVGVDMAGNVFAMGSFTGTVDFDPGSGAANLTSAGAQDIFISKLDTDGELVWAKKMGGTDNDSGNGVVIDPAGAVFLTGGFRLTADFDPGAGTANLTSAGMNDAFLVKLAPPPDTTPPHVTEINPATLGPTNATSIAFEVVFDEYVQNFNNAADLVITAAGGVASTGVTFSGTGYRYTVTITGITGTGTLTLAVNTGSDVQDLAGNALASSVTSPVVTIDNTPPPNAIAIHPSTIGPTNVGTVSFTVFFDKSVQGFNSAADLIFNHTGNVAHGSVTIAGSGALYTVTVTNITGMGQLWIAVSTTSDVRDLVNHPLASSVTSYPITFDPDAPPFPLAAWPAGVALLAAGMALLRGRKEK